MKRSLLVGSVIMAFAVAEAALAADNGPLSTAAT